MNILLLPDEMLASVFKYSKMEDLTTIRKLSSRVDSVTKKYNLDRVPMDNFGIYMNLPNYISVRLSGEKTQKIFGRTHYVETLPEVLQFYLPKIRGLQELGLINQQQTHYFAISNDVAELILGNSCKGLISLVIEDVDLTMSFEMMRRILTELKLKQLTLCSPFTNFKVTDEVKRGPAGLIDGLEFDCLLLSSRDNNSKIQLSCIERLCARKLPGALNCEVNSTASELGQFLERYLANSSPIELDWHFYVDRGTMSGEDIEPYFTGLKCFKNGRVDANYDEDVVELEIYSQNDDNWNVFISVNLQM